MSASTDSTASPQRISVAIVAMGGQGGGVLSDWLRDTAEFGGWHVQTTSVPGVAQRTGATIYYVELFRTPDDAPAQPVLALMPVAGDVDLVVAAEWLEAGRAIMRGLVTPDRTTLVASTHRSYATAEKIVPGDGRSDSGAVHRAAAIAARKLIAFDMAALADQHGSVISASLLGAIAASGALPFETEHYDRAITSGGIGVERSLAAFRASFEATQSMSSPDSESNPDNRHDHSQNADGVNASNLVFDLSGPLGQRVQAELPADCWPVAGQGVRRCIDFLDGAYAGQYLDRLGKVARQQNDAALLTEVARWLALRMCYEDTYRVADLKTRADRFQDIRGEVRASNRQVVHHTEYLHPRVEEIADSLPARWGQQLLDSPRLRSWVDAVFGKGRRIRTSSLSGFVVLAVLARRGRHRRATLRHQHEDAWIEQWLGKIGDLAPRNVALATAVAQLARLVKGYSDTQTRSQALFNRLFSIADGLAEREDGGAILFDLIDAALTDANGKTLDERIAKIGATSGEAQVSSSTATTGAAA